MSAKTNLDSPRNADAAGLGMPKFDSAQEKRPAAKAGTGEAASTLQSQKENEAADNLGVRQIRFCPFLDNSLPACVVQYIEQLCLTIYNCFVQLTGRAPVQVALPEDEEAGDDDAGLGPVNMKTLDPETIARLKASGDHSSPASPTSSAPAGSAPVTPTKPAVTMAAQQVETPKTPKKPGSFETSIVELSGDQLLTQHGRVFKFQQSPNPRQWVRGDKVEIYEGTRVHLDVYNLRNLSRTTVGLRFVELAGDDSRKPNLEGNVRTLKPVSAEQTTPAAPMTERVAVEVVPDSKAVAVAASNKPAVDTDSVDALIRQELLAREQDRQKLEDDLAVKSGLD